jgi:hypothetical protein
MIANPHPINLIHANPDMLVDPHQRVLSSLGNRYFQDKYNIGYRHLNYLMRFGLLAITLTGRSQMFHRFRSRRFLTLFPCQKIRLLVGKI